MNHIHLKLALMFSALIFLMWLAHSLPAQTLQRHPYPPSLHPESCREHVALTRHEFLDAAPWTNDKKLKDDLVHTYLNAEKPQFVAKICSTHRLESFYNLLIAGAIYTHRVGELDAHSASLAPVYPQSKP